MGVRSAAERRNVGPGIAVVAVLRAHVRTDATYFRALGVRAGSAACGCLGWVCAVRSNRMRSAGKNHRQARARTRTHARAHMSPHTRAHTRTHAHPHTRTQRTRRRPRRSPASLARQWIAGTARPADKADRLFFGLLMALRPALEAEMVLEDAARGGSCRLRTACGCFAPRTPNRGTRTQHCPRALRAHGNR
jgi:hypothetical protein